MGIIKYLKSKEFIITLISIVSIVILLNVALFKWLDVYTHHGEKIEVPSLLKKSLDETKESLDELSLNFVVIDSASFNPEYPPLSVIEQDPEPGDFVKENRKIYLTLNPLNYRNVEVPNVLDQTKRQVVTKLKSSGFIIGKERFIRDLGENVVRKLEQNGKELAPGTKIPKNSVIDLVLGDGLKDRKVDSLQVN